MTLTTATERVTVLGKKRDDALRRIEDNRKRRPYGERDNPYYDDCTDAVWGLYYANIKRLAT